MAHTSIKLYLSAICQLQIEQGLPDPFKTPMPMLEQVVKGIKVRQGKDGRIPRRKLSITPDILRRIRSSWETRKEEPKLLCYGQPAQYTFLGVCTHSGVGTVEAVAALAATLFRLVINIHNLINSYKASLVPLERAQPHASSLFVEPVSCTFTCVHFYLKYTIKQSKSWL